MEILSLLAPSLLAQWPACKDGISLDLEYISIYVNHYYLELNNLCESTKFSSYKIKGMHCHIFGIILIKYALMHVRKTVEHTFSKMFALNVGLVRKTFERSLLKMFALNIRLVENATSLIWFSIQWLFLEWILSLFLLEGACYHNGMPLPIICKNLVCSLLC